MLFCKYRCLVAHEKCIFRKCFSVLTCLWCKMISVFILPSNTIFRKTERERESVWVRLCRHAKREREREREAEERVHCRRPTSFDFAGDLKTSRHEPRSPFNFAVRLWLRIALRSHPLTLPANPEAKIARLRLHRLHTPSTSPRWHQDGTDRPEFAIEKWLDFDEFDRVWWIFFGWVLMNLTGSDEFFLVGFWWIWPDLCLSIEKLYYIFVWELRKCVFYIIFSNTTKHQKIFSKAFFEMQPNT